MGKQCTHVHCYTARGGGRRKEGLPREPESGKRRGLRILILSLGDLGVTPSKPSTGIARKTLFFWEFQGNNLVRSNLTIDFDFYTSINSIDESNRLHEFMWIECYEYRLN
ncbi:hypothetical protein EAG_01431 [Camponotus floridanus]|uniref:Uncharacterized protein n=1 Tax=Camponotus floridanus TaxID=104421 RepID=E2AV16_CAMFO|nr:hypothetical protein EAG_01431 [Camponotus floridanus]